MHTALKFGAGVALTIGLAFAGPAAAPEAATAAAPTPSTPLIERVDDVRTPSTYVISADASKVFVFDAQGGEGTIIDVASRQATGKFPAIPDQYPYAPNATLATGSFYVTIASLGYTVLNLDTLESETFQLESLPGFGSSADDYLALSISPAGDVTAVTDLGRFVTLEDGAITSLEKIHDLPLTESQLINYGLSTDGRHYFETRQPRRSAELTTSIVDMQTGDVVHRIEHDNNNNNNSSFSPFAFDASGTSLWGIADVSGGAGLSFELSNHDFLSGNDATQIPFDPQTTELWFGDLRNDSIVTNQALTHTGSSIATPAVTGGREIGFGAKPTQIPGSRDVVFIDGEMSQVGFLNGPKITDPTNAPVTRIGDIASFTSSATGLAMTDGQSRGSTALSHGAVWQSSSDGNTWNDMPGETNPTLNIKVTAANYDLQYRLHFLDGFWGDLSSAAARAIGTPPEITRADDLPAGAIDTPYPEQIITATGQSDLTWSASSLPTGLTMNSANGSITGTPTAAGEYEFAVTVTDAFGTATQTFHLPVTSSAVPPKPGPDPEPGKETSPQPSPKTTLANTGSSSTEIAFAGVALLLAAGAAALLFARQRRGATS